MPQAAVTTHTVFPVSQTATAITNFLLEHFADIVQFNIALKNYSYLKVGGTAAYFLKPQTPAQLAACVVQLRAEQLPYAILGRGTNTLINDGQLNTVIIHPSPTMSAEVFPHQHKITCPAGMLLIKAISLALQHQLGGMEFAAGIPGSIGGAVRMNAGTKLGCVKDYLISAEVLRQGSGRQIVPAAALALTYRASNLQTSEVVLSATFKLTPLSAAATRASKQNVLSQLQSRRRTQPLGSASLGSTFKNPPPKPAGGPPRHAAALIEAAGLKGAKRGGIHISTLHANFIINDGTGTASDARALIDHIIQTVAVRQGVSLELEIKLLGW